MGLRFRKSKKIAPGVKLNIGKGSASLSVGGKGAHVTLNSKGTGTASVGIPGSGLSYSKSKKLVGSAKTSKGKKTRKIVEIAIFIIAVIVFIVATYGSKIADKISEYTSTNQTVSQVTSSTLSDTSNVPLSDTTTATISSDTNEVMVWVSASGSKYHTKATCSGMENAKQISLSEAEKSYTPCKRCN